MLLASNNLLKYMDLPKGTIIRINMAWCQSLTELQSIIESLETDREIFLDYPQGRTKPPTPILTYEDALAILNKYPDKIKYFAMSNCESPEKLTIVRHQVPRHIKLVPKIETEEGVKNVVSIATACKTNIIMADKEDIFTNVQNNTVKYNELLNLCRTQCWKYDIIVLELEGVIFTEKRKINEA